MNRIAPFAERVHIDLMDGEFAPTISPGLADVWWPLELRADIHLMYERPMEQLELLLKLRPNLVVIHHEAQVDHMHFTVELHKAGILAGLAVLHDTPIEDTYQIVHRFDHVLVFSGHLGHHGGQADLGLLDKVRKIHEHHPAAEIGWDGGVTADIAPELVAAGVAVLNAGGYIQNAPDPRKAYAKIKSAITER